MRFTVLGPLQVGHRGADLTPTAPRLRTVLALLLTAPNTVLPDAALLRELWGDTPPAGATTTLQSYVVQLRRRLDGDARPDRTRDRGDAHIIRTEGGGYTLRTDAATVDFVEFRQAVDLAQEACRRGGYEPAAEHLRRGLALWRGTPLSGVAHGPALRTFTRYLDEMWLSATELRVALDMAAGRHREILDELTPLLRRFPLNENLCAQLMLALHRAGRTQAARDAYRTLRRTMITELGLDPCPALQRLFHAVSAVDAARDGPDRIRLPAALDLLAG